MNDLQMRGVNPLNGLEAGNFEIFKKKNLKGWKRNESDKLEEQRLILLCFFDVK